VEGKIKVDIQKIGWEVVGWIHLIKDRDWCQVLMNTVMNC
jgi:hypothetical protein